MENRVTILIPVYNDWASLGLLLPKIQESLKGGGEQLKAVIVDDGSTISPPADLRENFNREGNELEIVHLTRNLGHQKAITIGLAYLNAEVKNHCDIIVMDADGEDSPDDLPKLLRASRENQGRAIVFAERKRRSEGLAFRFGYLMYQLLHLVLTGRTIKFGNFSLIPAGKLGKLVTLSEMWNHFAAAVVIAGLPLLLVPTERGRRLVGNSKMNYTSLILHGLAALAVYADRIGVRLFTIACLGTFASLLLLATGLLMESAGIIALPDPIVLVFLCTSVLLAIAVGISIHFILSILQSRSSRVFIPSRDYVYYIDRKYRQPV